MKLEFFSTDFLKILRCQIFTQIGSVGAELLHADRQTWRIFSQFCERAQKPWSLAYAAKYMRNSFSFSLSGPFRSNLSVKNPETPLKMGYPETSVRNYHYPSCTRPDDRSSWPLRTVTSVQHSMNQTNVQDIPRPATPSARITQAKLIYVRWRWNQRIFNWPKYKRILHAGQFVTVIGKYLRFRKDAGATSWRWQQLSASFFFPCN